MGDRSQHQQMKANELQISKYDDDSFGLILKIIIEKSILA